MTEEKYRKEVEDLIYDAPTSNPPNWPKWKLPSRNEGESFETHLSRLKQFKAGYFERVKKLEDGIALAWM